MAETDERLRGLDWEAIERSPEFQELVTRRRSFVLPATIFFLTYYMAFILLAGYAPDFMGERLIDGFTVGYALALTQFVMTWFLGWLYLRRSNRMFDPPAKRAAERAVELSSTRTAGGNGPRTDGHGNGGREVRH